MCLLWTLRRLTGRRHAASREVLYAEGRAPDVRRASAATHAAWDAIVRDGARAPAGMPAFGSLLSQAEIDAIHAYAIERARALAAGR